MVGITIPFLQILDFDLWTYTTTYPQDVAGWSWANCALPLDFHVSTGSASAPPPSYVGNIFDYQSGLTRFQVGGSLVSPSAAYGVGCYFSSGVFTTYGYNGVLSPNVYGDAFSFTFGEAVTRNASWQTLRNVAGTNTGYPAAAAGNAFNGVIGGEYGFYTQGWNPSLTYEYDLWNGISLKTTATTPGIPWTGAVGGPNNTAMIPNKYGLNVCVTDINGSGAGNRFLITDFATGYTQYSPTYINPTGFDINTYLLQDGGGAPRVATSRGFYYPNVSTATINGVTMNGFGILVKPELDGYYILNFHAKDANAAGWNTRTGPTLGKFDRNDYLFLMNSNFSQNILVAQRTPLKLNATNGALWRMKHNHGFFR